MESYRYPEAESRRHRATGRGGQIFESNLPDTRIV
jgi:hypothetical protein